jgi:hypothetical protein
MKPTHSQQPSSLRTHPATHTSETNQQPRNKPTTHTNEIGEGREKSSASQKKKKILKKKERKKIEGDRELKTIT